MRPDVPNKRAQAAPGKQSETAQRPMGLSVIGGSAQRMVSTVTPADRETVRCQPLAERGRYFFFGVGSRLKYWARM
jgi:hypothetical protein